LGDPMILFNPFLKGLVGVLFAVFASVGLYNAIFGTLPGAVWKAFLAACVIGLFAYFLLDAARSDYRRTKKLWHW